jgi:hypothetical protein
MVIPSKDTTPHARRMSALQALLAATKLTISASEQAASANPPQTRRFRALQQKERIMSDLAAHKQKLDLLKLEDPNNLRRELEDSTGYTDLGEGEGKGKERKSLREDIEAHCEHYKFGLDTVGAALEYIAEMYMKGVDDGVSAHVEL